MTETRTPDPNTRARYREGVLYRWQVVWTGFTGLLVLVITSNLNEIRAPGAPVLLFWTTVAAGIALTIWHSPIVFLRLPELAKAAGYGAWLLFFALFGVTLAQLNSAWEQTPQGKAEAKQQQAAEAAEAAEERRQQQARSAEEQRQHQAENTRREGERVLAELQDREKKLERCFSYFGHHLPALEKAVKDGLENPHSFEQVETVAIVPDDHHNDVAMTFRAENGFGALRTARIKASVVPETCEIISIDDPEML